MEISVIEIAEILYKLQVGREVIQGHYPDNTADMLFFSFLFPFFFGRGREREDS